MSKFYQPTPKEVKEARLFANLTQSESADLCLITSNTWARYEQGTTQMPAPIWKLFEYAIAHRNASQSIKGVSKQQQAMIDAEEAEKLAILANEWSDETIRREELEAEAKYFAYRDGRPAL